MFAPGDPDTVLKTRRAEIIREVVAGMFILYFCWCFYRSPPDFKKKNYLIFFSIFLSFFPVGSIFNFFSIFFIMNPRPRQHRGDLLGERGQSS